MPPSRRLAFILLTALFVTGCGLVTVELGLRAYKSLAYDGVLHLATSSINNRPHPKYGWLSPTDQVTEKSDTCYGTGSVSYNTEGFRAPEPEAIPNADLLVCVLGDSTMQGYQIPDGGVLAHRLAKRLEKRFQRPYVLPAAVGGFGTLQEHMLYEDYCRNRKPGVIIHHWAQNDPLNNNYQAERLSRSGNMRRRPYLERGEIVYRVPSPIHISSAVNDTLLMRVLNHGILKLSAGGDFGPHRKEGMAVARELLKTLGAEPAPIKIGLVPSGAHEAIAAYVDAGFDVVTYDQFPPEMMCLPRDSHPTSAGHEMMLNRLWPSLSRRLDQHFGPRSEGTGDQTEPGAPSPPYSSPQFTLMDR